MFFRHILAVVALLCALGCSGRGDINRVQPNVTQKSDLVGTAADPKLWFFRNTVTWTPSDTGFTYAGETGRLEKILFEIQEHHLVGYRAYPYILGVDPNVDAASRVAGTTAKYCSPDGQCLGGQPYFGSPVVSFPIESHFDIQRPYNTVTGESTNVIVENTTDRPWNERQYIRVNWAVNELNPSAGIQYGTLLNAAGGSSQSSWIQPNESTEDSQDRPTFEVDDKGTPKDKRDDELNYFDVTGRYIANPTLQYIEDYGYVPACYLSPSYDCTSSEIRMRMSFSRVNKAQNRNYESLIYPLDLQTKFGFYGIDRLNWDKKFGATDSAVLRIAGRFRIWNEAYKKDERGEPILSQPLAMKDRTPKPIVYYVSAAERMGGKANYDLYREPASILEQNWDRAFRRAAAAAQEKAATEYQQVLFVCDNPVIDYSTKGLPAAEAEARQKACGAPGFAPKFGDLRYSFVNTVAEPVPNGLLGYGPNSTDPETGEIISANANTYLGGIETESQNILDLIDLLTADPNAQSEAIQKYIKGDVAKSYVLSNPVYSVRKLPRGNSSQSALLAEGAPVESSSERSLGAFERPAEGSRRLISTWEASGGLPHGNGDPMRAAADKLQKSPELESLILDNPDFASDLEALLPKGLSDRLSQSSNSKREYARKLLLNARQLNQFARQRLQDLTSTTCHYLAEFDDRTLLSVALAEKKTRDDEIAKLVNEQKLSTEQAIATANENVKRRLKQRIWRATSEHEIGHTFNLVHNFQGSFDAINYHDKYWELRRQTLLVQTQANGPKFIPRTTRHLQDTADGTQTQHEGGMYDYEYSSIMDYAGTRTADWQGIGKYDEAAILFAYSGDSAPGYVEAFEQLRGTRSNFPGSDGKMVEVTGAAFDLPVVNAKHFNVNARNYTEQYHYTMVPLHFGEGANLDQVMDDGIQKLKKRKLVSWKEAEAARQRLREVIARKGGAPLTEAEVAATNPVFEVPYANCSDPHKQKVLSCNWFDRGPDYYEMNRTKLENYWNYYFANHFRRDRSFFSTSSSINVAYSTFQEVSDVYKQWVLNLYRTAAPNQQGLNSYNFDVQFQDYWTMAVLDGINQNLNVMSVPPAGFFAYRNFSGIPILDSQGNQAMCTTDAQCYSGVCSTGKCVWGPQWEVLSEGNDFDTLTAAGKDLYRRTYVDPRRVSPPAQGFGEMARGRGRRMYSRYDFKSGYGFYDRLLEAGHYNDQFGAMFAAIDSESQLYDVDYQSDANRYRIPYYLVFNKELTRTFASLWTADLQDIRPYAYRVLQRQPTGQQVATEELGLLQHRFVKGSDYIKDFDYPLNAVDKPVACSSTVTTNCLITSGELNQLPAPINLQLTFTSRFYALYLGSAGFPTNFDLDYAKANQVYKLGGREEVKVAPGFHTVEVEDAVSGSRYAAIEEDGQMNPYSTPAIRMVREANDYLTVVKTPQMCPLPGTLRRYSCMPEADRTNPTQVELSRRNWLESYRYAIRDLDIMRGFYSLFGKVN